MFQNRDIIQNVCLILGEKIFLDFLKITVDKNRLTVVSWYRTDEIQIGTPHNDKYT